MKAVTLLLGALALGCVAPRGVAAAPSEQLAILSVVPVGGLDACRPLRWAARAPNVCILRSGEVIVFDALGKAVARTAKLESGCEAGDAWVVGGGGVAAVFLPYDCKVTGATLMFVARDREIHAAGQASFNFLPPILVPGAVIVVDGGEAGRLEWPSLSWGWSREHSRGGDSDVEGFTPAQVITEGTCIVMTEDKVSAAQYHRAPSEVRLAIADGRVASREECSSKASSSTVQTGGH